MRAADYPGAVNLREIADLPTGDGRHLRSGVLFRSGTPQLMDDETGQRLIADLGVSLVVDLRTPGETLSEGEGGLRLCGHRRVHSPIVSGSAHPDGHPVPRFTASADPLVPHYLAYLDGSGPALLQMFRALSQPGGAPALLHCTAGKDRTGAAVMLILDALGIERPAIAADYAAGSDALSDVFARLIRLPTYGARLAEMPAEAKTATEETALRFLAQVDERFGGTVAWLRRIGFGDTELEDLRAQLLTRAPSSAGSGGDSRHQIGG